MQKTVYINIKNVDLNKTKEFNETELKLFLSLNNDDDFLELEQTDFVEFPYKDVA
jgi:hypothetical protein